MNQRTLVGRLLSPAGFGLVLIFFLLPFATVSCGNSAEQVQATFSGLDLAIGGLPDVITPDSDPASAEQVAQLVVQVSDLEPLALLAALAVLAGMAVAALPRVRIRHGAAVALAAIAAGLMVAAIARAPGRVNEFLRQLAGAEDLPTGAIFEHQHAVRVLARRVHPGRPGRRQRAGPAAGPTLPRARPDARGEP